MHGGAVMVAESALTGLENERKIETGLLSLGTATAMGCTIGVYNIATTEKTLLLSCDASSHPSAESVLCATVGEGFVKISPDSYAVLKSPAGEPI